MSLAPPHIASIQPYKPGKPIAEVERELGLDSSIKLASNENPVGPSARVFKSLRGHLREISRYPDGSAFALTRALAKKFDVAPEMILLGNGSNELIEIAVRTFLRPGEEVVSARGAFVVYQLATQAAGGTNVVVPLRQHTHDLPAMAAAVTSRTRLVFVANPNNPTGTWVGEREVERFFKTLPEGPIVVFDEAYYEYVTRRGFPETLRRVREGRPVFCLRTFSKAYGLAGLRLGYLFGPPEYVAEMNKVREPFNTNHLAQIAAVAALEDERHLRKVVRLNRRERERLARALAALGLVVVPSEANFLLVDLACDGNTVYEELLRRGVIVRPVGNYGYPRHLRITIGLPSENDRLLAALGEVLAAMPPQ